MKKTATGILKPVRPVIQPINARRVELKQNPAAASSIDEDIYLTRSRISALNSVVNGLLSDFDLQRLAKAVNWGIFSVTVKRDNRKDVPLPPSNADKVNLIRDIIYDRIPGLDSVSEHLNEDAGVYVVTAVRDGKSISGLGRELRAEAWVSTLCALGINVLNEKVSYQYQLLNQEEARNLGKGLAQGKSSRFDRLRGPEVPKAFDEDDTSENPNF